MKRLYTAGLLVIVVAAVSLSGCSSLLERLQLKDPTPTPPGIYMPITSPTPSPTPVPSATSGPIVIKPEPDSSVIIYPWPAMDYKMYSWDRGYSGQTENFTFIVENTDTKPVKNIVMLLKITDTQKGTIIHDQMFEIGDMGRGEYKIYYAVTAPHDPSYLMNVYANLQWGEYREYFNPNTFERKSVAAYA